MLFCCWICNFSNSINCVYVFRFFFALLSCFPLWLLLLHCCFHCLVPNFVSFVLKFQRHSVSFLILFPSCFDSNSALSRYPPSLNCQQIPNSQQIPKRPPLGLHKWRQMRKSGAQSAALLVALKLAHSHALAIASENKNVCALHEAAEKRTRTSGAQRETLHFLVHTYAILFSYLLHSARPSLSVLSICSSGGSSSSSTSSSEK